MVYLREYKTEDDYLNDLDNIKYGVAYIKNTNSKSVKFIHKNRMKSNNNILLNIDDFKHGKYSLYYESADGKPIEGFSKIVELTV